MRENQEQPFDVVLDMLSAISNNISVAIEGTYNFHIAKSNPCARFDPLDPPPTSTFSRSSPITPKSSISSSEHRNHLFAVQAISSLKCVGSRR
jgi:hypothetical protein